MTRIPEAEYFASYAERIAKLDYPTGSFDETEAKKIDLDLKNSIVLELRIISNSINNLNGTLVTIRDKEK